MAKKNNPYFNGFITLADMASQAATYLETVLTHYDPAVLATQRAEMHAIEHAQDGVRHDLMAQLAKEFVTPIDREDIIQLANKLDDVTDHIDDILIRLYMYNIQTLRPPALQFATLITRCCTALQKAMSEFSAFRKSTMLTQCLIDINALEEEGDALYIEAMRELYENETDAIAIAAWSQLYDCLENCCDACEQVADMVEIVVMKNL